MVEAENLTGKKIEVKSLVRLAEEVLKGEGAGEAVDGSLAFVPPEEIKGLNNFFRSKNEPTDVLSFDLSLEKQTGRHLFQVVVCPDEVKEGEMKRTVIHGFLHLLGHEDETETGLGKMRAKEEEYLNKRY